VRLRYTDGFVALGARRIKAVANRRASGHFHAVQFYQDDNSLIAIAARFLADGFKQSQPGIVIATPEHAVAIEESLATYQLDVKRMKQLGDLVVLDARQVLDTIMVDGMPHAPLFKHVVGTTFTEAARIHPERTIRAYGEMVNVLWKDGLTAAAIRLETLWNELAKSYDFKLLCGYAMGNFYKDAAVGEITRQHSHLLVETGEAATIN
jgi:hypothetical protein